MHYILVKHSERVKNFKQNLVKIIQLLRKESNFKTYDSKRFKKFILYRKVRKFQNQKVQNNNRKKLKQKMSSRQNNYLICYRVKNK